MSRALLAPVTLASALAACGGMTSQDTSLDATVHDGAPDASSADGCDAPGYGMCCRGKWCNGFCSSGCYCGNEIECPASTRCCWNSVRYACRLPAECTGCDAVGKGQGLESCCDQPPFDRYCRGVCIDAAFYADTCQCGATGGCSFGPGYKDEVCCPQSGGAPRCVPAGTCP